MNGLTLGERIESIARLVEIDAQSPRLAWRLRNEILADVQELERDASRYKKLRWGSAASRFRVKYFSPNSGFETVAMGSLDEKLDAIKGDTNG